MDRVARVRRNCSYDYLYFTNRLYSVLFRNFVVGVLVGCGRFGFVSGTLLSSRVSAIVVEGLWAT